MIPKAEERGRTNLILVGMPGCGKSTVGRELAHRLGRPLADTDDLMLERIGCGIQEYYRRVGEEQFRRLEREILAEVLEQDGLVVSPGGGIVILPENRELMRRRGTVIFLHRPPEELPSAGRAVTAGGLEELYRRRRPLYEKVADLTVENRQADEAAEEILVRLHLNELA